MYKTKFTDIKEFAAQLKKGTFGIYCATMTEKKMNKYPNGTTAALRKTAQENPYMGKVFTFSVYQNAATGLNYYTIVKAECKREGIDFTDDEFKAAIPYEETYCENADDSVKNVIMEHKTNGQEYLRLYKGRKPTKVVHFTIYNGEIVEEGSDLMKDIMRYVPKSNGSKKQESLGITNIVEVKQPKIENVMFIGQGEKAYINPRFANCSLLDIETLDKFFKK